MAASVVLSAKGTGTIVGRHAWQTKHRVVGRINILRVSCSFLRLL